MTSTLKQSREMALRARFDNSPLIWERVGYELEKALDKDAVIVPELGTEYYKLLRQLTLGGANKQKIGRTKGDALGWGVAAAFGVNVALPERQVVAVQGDGGFLFNQSEVLWSIARYEAPLLIVIMNNRLYNESRDRNMLNGGLLYDLGKDFNGYLGDPNVEFTKIAEAYGLKGEKVKSASELAPALQRSLKSMRDGKAVVLDIDIAPDGPALSQGTWYQRYSHRGDPEEEAERECVRKAAWQDSRGCGKIDYGGVLCRAGARETPSYPSWSGISWCGFPPRS